MSPEQEAALERIPGWLWEWRDELWEQRCAEVEAFVQAHGQLPRQKSGNRPLVLNEVVLAEWCCTQRQRRRGRGGYAPLNPGQLAALQRIPGWWWAK